MIKWRLRCYRAILSYYIVAMAQFLSPAAAADPASKINPPEWSYRHTQEEMQSYATSAIAQEPEKNNVQLTCEARLRRMIRQYELQNRD